MKVNKHINIESGLSWHSCKRVEFKDGGAIWELNPAPYDLMASYEQAPHLELIDAITDDALMLFVKKWGPLRFALAGWSGRDRITDYRIVRDSLTLRVQLLDSVGDSTKRRYVLRELWKLSDRDAATGSLLTHLRDSFPIPGEVCWKSDPHISAWLEAATEKEIETAIIDLIPASHPAIAVPSFRVERTKRNLEVHASPGITSLTQALGWMVWQDVFLKRPIQICEECHKIFQPEYRHKKKFCGELCARRKTSREFERRKRKKGKPTNGTQKAR